MNIPTVTTKSVFEAKDIESGLHFGHKVKRSDAACKWSHVEKNRATK